MSNLICRAEMRSNEENKNKKNGKIKFRWRQIEECIQQSQTHTSRIFNYSVTETEIIIQSNRDGCLVLVGTAAHF